MTFVVLCCTTDGHEMPYAQAVARIFRLSWCVSDIWPRVVCLCSASVSAHTARCSRPFLHTNALTGCDTETLLCNRDCAYSNGFPVVAKGLDMYIPMTSATNGNIHLGRGSLVFGWMCGVWTQSGSVAPAECIATWGNRAPETNTFVYKTFKVRVS